MIRIAPSILSSDFSRLGEEIKAAEAAGADWIHVDVMDGHFVPNITIGPAVVQAISKVTTLPMDVHLMIENPDQFIEAFAKAGATLLTVHPEACLHLHRTICAIKEMGIKAGVALNPSTPLSVLDWVLEDLDLILIMSVNPGFGGQAFIPKSVEKIEKTRAMLSKCNAKAILSVDGGINEQTIGRAAKAGAEAFVAGAAFYGSKDYGATIKKLRASAAQS